MRTSSVIAAFLAGPLAGWTRTPVARCRPGRESGKRRRHERRDRISVQTERVDLSQRQRANGQHNRRKGHECKPNDAKPGNQHRRRDRDAEYDGNECEIRRCHIRRD